ncbi:plasmid replication initiation protein [Salmonella enterica]|nr:plasmid replication initiation protein [Salmonella enterica]EAR7356901.1 plasmid replication initiation protein [Salmonella enterica]
MSETDEYQGKSTNLEIPEGKDNYNFVQVNRAYLREWRNLTRKNPLSSEILMYLVENMGKTSNAVICSYVTLTEVTGVSRSSVARAVKLLKDDRWLESIKIGNATAYCINAAVFWQAQRNHKKYAIFQATAIASATEQDSDFHEKAKQPLRFIPFVGKEERMLVSDEELPPPDQTDLDLN